MQLHDHPFVKWPPTWTRIEGDGDTNVTGEIGILRDSSGSRVEPKLTCYLIVDEGASSYMGQLDFEDGAVCRQVLALLQTQGDRSIKEIGNIELA